MTYNLERRKYLEISRCGEPATLSALNKQKLGVYGALLIAYKDDLLR